MRQIFLDTETTGLSPDNGDRIVEIGCVELLNRRLTDHTLHHYLNPERPNHEEAVRVHGLTDAFLADKPLFAAVVDELLDFVAGAEVIIHNAAFDIGFLDAELRRLGRPAFSTVVGRVVDSLTMAREMFPGKANSLDALCRRFEVDTSERTLHGALLDAGLLAEVYLRMTRGQKDLGMDLHDLDGGAGGSHSIDLRQYSLRVLGPTADELQAHQALLTDIDKASGGKTVWRKYE
jgi:DNA polymerase-3 subunit epsilon